MKSISGHKSSRRGTTTVASAATKDRVQAEYPRTSAAGRKSPSGMAPLKRKKSTAGNRSFNSATVLWAQSFRNAPAQPSPMQQTTLTQCAKQFNSDPGHHDEKDQTSGMSRNAEPGATVEHFSPCVAKQPILASGIADEVFDPQLTGGGVGEDRRVLTATRAGQVDPSIGLLTLDFLTEFRRCRSAVEEIAAALSSGKQSVKQPAAPPVDPAVMEALAGKALLDLGGVKRLSRASRSTIYKWVSEQRFPKPIKLTAKITRWVASEVEAWLDTQALARDAADIPVVLDGQKGGMA